MASKPELFKYDFDRCSESSLSAPYFALGICEVVSVGAWDELPYVFEISGGQRLSFSLISSHETDLILCSEYAYDAWVEEGLQTEHPPDAIVTLKYARHHSLEFKPETDMTLIAIIINLADCSVESAVAASILDLTGKPC